MNLQKLRAQYASALADIVLEQSQASKRWAQLRAEYYRGQIAAERRKRARVGLG